MTDIPTKLATATDELTEQIALLERDLTHLNLAVEASIEIGMHDAPKTLSLGRLQDRWRFFLKGASLITTLVVSASMDDKILAVKHLPELIAKLVETSRAREGHLRETAAAVRELRASLKTATSS